MNGYSATRSKFNLFVYLRIFESNLSFDDTNHEVLRDDKKKIVLRKAKKFKNVEILHYGAKIFEICLERDGSFYDLISSFKSDITPEWHCRTRDNMSWTNLMTKMSIKRFRLWTFAKPLHIFKSFEWEHLHFSSLRIILLTTQSMIRNAQSSLFMMKYKFVFDEEKGSSWMSFFDVRYVNVSTLQIKIVTLST